MQPDAPYEALTPIQVEEQLRNLHNRSGEAARDIRAARAALAKARAELTRAKAVLEFAISDATLDPACPVVGRGAGEFTIGYRNAWVVRETRAERQAVLDATAVVQAGTTMLASAIDFRTAVSEQLMAVQSINKSTIEAYRSPVGGHR
jgi:hypothetical protein